MHKPTLVATLCLATATLGGGSAAAQGFGSPQAKPTGRLSFFTNNSHVETDSGSAADLGELTTAFTFELPDADGNGVEYGIDLRHSRYTSTVRPDRLSIYEGFVGARLADGRVRLRAGQLWLNDLGSLGSVAGAAVEWRQRRSESSGGRLHVGGFSGLEPDILELGYAHGVKKLGGYVTYEGQGTQRHTVGYVRVQNQSVIERSVVTSTNFVPVGRKFFLYQAMEYDLQPPATRAKGGLTYFFTTARAIASERVEIQGTYNRGHSVDVRSLSEDILNGRPITQTAAEGLLYESIGGRVTVEVARRVRVYGGYASDKNSRDAAPTGRVLVGGYASNIAGSGLDLSASDNTINRPTGRYHSRYVSVGRQLGRHLYASVDYTTSLSVVRFSRSDGVTVESRPHTARLSGTASVNLPGSISLLISAEQTRDDDMRDRRLLAGITFRIH